MKNISSYIRGDIFILTILMAAPSAAFMYDSGITTVTTKNLNAILGAVVTGVVIFAFYLTKHSERFLPVGLVRSAIKFRTIQLLLALVPIAIHVAVFGWSDSYPKRYYVAWIALVFLQDSLSFIVFLFAPVLSSFVIGTVALLLGGMLTWLTNDQQLAGRVIVDIALFLTYVIATIVAGYVHIILLKTIIVRWSKRKKGAS